jgi:hypothetical protein
MLTSKWYVNVFLRVHAKDVTLVALPPHSLPFNVTLVEKKKKSCICVVTIKKLN